MLPLHLRRGPVVARCMCTHSTTWCFAVCGSEVSSREALHLLAQTLCVGGGGLSMWDCGVGTMCAGQWAGGLGGGGDCKKHTIPPTLLS